MINVLDFLLTMTPQYQVAYMCYNPDMNSNLSQIAPEILKVIKESQNILLHLHPRPDGDSVGSALGMRGALLSLGKNVTIIGGDSPFPKYLAHLPGVDSITAKNFFEIDLSVFDLFIIQDSSAPGHISTLGEVIFPESLKTIVIDHHISNQGFAKNLNLVDANYPSVCQMLVDIFNVWQVEITHDMALCLLTGIHTDTGGFRYRGVTEGTFTAAAQLAKAAPDFPKVFAVMENSNTKGKLRYEGLALSSISEFLNGTLAISIVSYEQLQKNNITREEAKAEIPNILKSVTEWKIGISMVEEAPGEIKISTRTQDGDKFDLSKVVEVLGGGGHKAAAGAFVKMPLQDAVTKLVSTVEALYGSELK